VNELLQLDDPFRHVSTRDLISPLLALFYHVARVGRENSVFLHEQAQAASSPLASLAADQRLAHEFTTACRATVLFAQRLPAGQVEAPSADMLALAERALQQQTARKSEDLAAWADRLARDVGNATD
jgi:hypothetical protein